MTTLDDLPNINPECIRPIDPSAFAPANDPGHPPKILLLYGSVREISYSRLVAEESDRLLQWFGAQTQIFDPRGLPQVDSCEATHEKVAELRDLATWAEGMVWVSPERHGAMTGIMKTQIDWLPLAPLGGIRLTQGKTLAVSQVCGGSQSFNTVNQLRILGRWMRMVTIPNQSSVARAFTEFDENNRMKPSSYYNRMVDVMEELVRFTWMVRSRSPLLTDRYSERVESVEQVHRRVSQPNAR